MGDFKQKPGNPRISIVVPVAISGRDDGLRLNRLLDSIASQSFSDFEIVLSDDSPSGVVEDLLSLRTETMDLHYWRNPHPLGNSSVNQNFAISRATGTFIKVMHQDDFFVSPSSMGAIAELVLQGDLPFWGSVGFVKFDELTESFSEPIKPSLNTTLGPPSCVFFKNEPGVTPLFDESLVFCNDHDLYQKLLWKFGMPAIIPEPLVAIGIHSSQVTEKLSRDRVKAEQALVLARQRVFLVSAGFCLAQVRQQNGIRHFLSRENRLLYVHEKADHPNLIATSGNGLHPLKGPPLFFRSRARARRVIKRLVKLFRFHS